MKKPSRWFLKYEDSDLYQREVARHGGSDWEIHTADIITREDVTSLAAARLLARTRERKHHVTIFIYERIHFTNDPIDLGPKYPGLYEDSWEWEEEIRQELTNGRFTIYKEHTNG